MEILYLEPLIHAPADILSAGSSVTNASDYIFLDAGNKISWANI